MGRQKKCLGTVEISNCLDKLDKIEKSFPSHPKTLEVLFQSGILTGSHAVMSAGDFNLITWSHSSDGSFSVGALERARHEDKPFPEHEHKQRLWLLCSKGSAIVTTGNKENMAMEQGDYAVVEPMTPHIIQAITEECTILMVTIPADPGLRHERTGKD